MASAGKKLLSTTQATVASEVDWVGHPWVLPAFIWLTLEAVVVAAVVTIGEILGGLAFRHVIGPLSLLYLTLIVIFVLWLVGALRLAVERATHKYVLRGSSLEIQRGLLSKRIYTVSASGFSDLEVIKSIPGRILNMGTIVIETDSARDLRLLKIRDPLKVAAMIRQVMTVPVVRVASSPPPPPPYTEP